MCKSPFLTIGPDRLRSYLGREDVQVIDLRDPEDYEARHLKGARSIPYDTLSDNLWQLDRRRIVFLYCTHGTMSIRAAKELADLGYRAVTLAGGVYPLLPDRSGEEQKF